MGQCLKKACWRASASWSPAAARAWAPQWGDAFIELGAELVICGRRLECWRRPRKNPQRSRRRGATIRCDIRDGAAVDAMMDAIWHDKPIDVLVNNAAATFIAQTEHLSFRAADAILAPTLHGTMYCTLSAGRRWIEGKRKAWS